jgi:THO complex subunit 1
MSAVTAVLQAVKLDGAAHADGSAPVAVDDVYFAKYLTNPKLMELQLADSSFRRQVQGIYFLLSILIMGVCVAVQLLVQCLVLFQYLKAEVKFKK